MKKKQYSTRRHTNAHCTTRKQPNTQSEEKKIHYQKTNQYTTRGQTNTQPEDKPGLGTAFFPVHNLPFFPVLLKNVPFFPVLFLSFWQLMRPKRMECSF